MSEVDENIAKLKMQRRLLKEQQEAMEKDNLEEENNNIDLDDVIKQIQSGNTTINGVNFIFRSKTYLDGKLQIPIPLAYFEEKSNTKELLSLINENGLSVNVSYMDKDVKEVAFSEFKIDFEKNIKSMGFSLKWLEEGEIKHNNETLYYGTYEIPTARGVIYNLVFYKVKNLNSIIGTYNCFKKDFDTWGPIIKATINLLKVIL